MPEFGESSDQQLATLHPKLQVLLSEAIKYYDFTVLEGFRGEEKQNLAFAQGKSKVRWPEGKHNKQPSEAVDLAPYPIDWDSKVSSLMRFGILAGVIKTCAEKLGIKVRWGGDWNRNFDPRDETFHDWGHFELDS